MEAKVEQEHIYVEGYEAIEFRDTKDLCTIRGDDGHDPGPMMRNGIAATQSCFVQFKSNSGHCGMFVSKEDLEILKVEKKILVEYRAYFFTFNDNCIVSIKTPSGKIINPLRNPLSVVLG